MHVQAAVLILFHLAWPGRLLPDGDVHLINAAVDICKHHATSIRKVVGHAAHIAASTAVLLSEAFQDRIKYDGNDESFPRVLERIRHSVRSEAYPVPTIPTRTDGDDALDRLLESLMQGVVDTIEPRDVTPADAVGDMARYIHEPNFGIDWADLTGF